MQAGTNKAFWFLLAGTLAVRTAMVLSPGALHDDPDGYRLLAENLVWQGQFAFNGVPTAYRPPLYPLLLTTCVIWGPAAPAAIAVVHVLLGVATVGLSYHLARQLGLGSWSLLAAALVAVDPILLAQSAQVMTETLATFLVVVALLLLIRAGESPRWDRCLWAGVALGTVMLCRANLVVWVPLAVCWIAWRRGWRDRGFFSLVTTGAGIVLTVAPWAVRNHVLFGRPVVTTTHGGYTLLLANNPWYYKHLQQYGWRRVWDAEKFNRQWETKAVRRRPADELRNQAAAYRASWNAIWKEPAAFLTATAVRIVNFWGVLPHRVSEQETPSRTVARWAVGCWYSLQWVLVIAGAAALAGRPRPRPPLQWRNSLRQWMLGILLIASLTVVHAVFWSNMRMRAPAVPVLACVAALGAGQLQRSLRRPSSPTSKAEGTPT